MANYMKEPTDRQHCVWYVYGIQLILIIARNLVANGTVHHGTILYNYIIYPIIPMLFVLYIYMYAINCCMIYL